MGLGKGSGCADMIFVAKQLVKVSVTTKFVYEISKLQF